MVLYHIKPTVQYRGIFARGVGGLQYEMDADARRKLIRIKTLKETNLGVAQA